ncbi:MAG: inosine/xanthosine triphosphatase [Anaerolineaceae bacterium]|nr:inosine/xanthosine triphosphatase [Anaerolineaceae bacterium]
MKKIVIASQNPVKIRAALNGFQQMFPHEIFQTISIAVESGVGVQPTTDQETFQGAINRVQNARLAVPEGDYWVGIEGGIQPLDDEITAFAWIVITDGVKSGKGRTGAFVLPKTVAHLIGQGMELGEADDFFFKRTNSKQENGAIGLLTGDIIDREKLYQPAVIMALIPFKNPELYKGKV